MQQINLVHLIGVEKRFWSKVDCTGGADACWIWRASSGTDGYGQFFPTKYERRRAHRYAWELTYGPIPDDKQVCHNCPDGDNLLCVNPRHLFLGDHQRNMADMAAKGRASRHGQTWLGRSKVGPDQVREIRARRAAGESLRTLMADYGLSKSGIQSIYSRRCWTHI